MSVSVKFCLLFTAVHFTLVLLQAFRFLQPVKGPRIRLQILQLTLPYLHLLAYTCLHLLIYTCVLFIILCELDKIDKIWEM